MTLNSGKCDVIRHDTIVRYCTSPSSLWKRRGYFNFCSSICRHLTGIKYGKCANVVFFFLALRILLNTSPLCTRGLQPHTERVRQESRERSVLVPMVLAVSKNNRQRHCLSKIWLQWMFQWKWAATQGNIRKTETKLAKTTVYMTTTHTNRLAVPSQ